MGLGIHRIQTFMVNKITKCNLEVLLTVQLWEVLPPILHGCHLMKMAVLGASTTLWFAAFL